MFVFCNIFFFERHLPPRWWNGGLFSQHRRCSCPAKGEVILMSAVEWVIEKYHSNQPMAWRFIFVLSELLMYSGSIFVVWDLSFCILKARRCCVKIWNCYGLTDWLTCLGVQVLQPATAKKNVGANHSNHTTSGTGSTNPGQVVLPWRFLILIDFLSFKGYPYFFTGHSVCDFLGLDDKDLDSLMISIQHVRL